LKIKSNVIDNLFELIKNDASLLVRSELVSKNSTYLTLHNTTDVLGLKNLFFTCCENLNNTVEIYSQDISNSNFNEEVNNKNFKNENTKESIIQFYLFEPTARQSVRNFLKIFNS